VVFLVWGILAIQALSLPREDPTAAEPIPGRGPWNLTIFHTNDIHGAFLPEPAMWRQDRAEVGGVIALACHLAEQRRSAEADLLLDAGDLMTGTPLCNVVDQGVKGGGLVDMMNLLGYDAGVIGNHEFDHGRHNACGLAARAEFPLLAADLVNEQGEPEFPQEPVVFERGGLKIGILGVSCAELFDVTASGRTGGLSLRDQVTVVREGIAELDPPTDLLVLITHNGVSTDEDLARELAGSGLDVIVGGHSHTRLNTPRLVEGILIVQAGSHLKNLGRLDLRVEDDRVAGYRGGLIQLTAAGTAAGPELTALVAEYQERIDAQFGRVVCTLETDWRRDGGGESNIGNWMCDRVRERAGADVALLNSGGIRQNQPAGPVTLLDIQRMLPFSNSLVTCRLSGAELLEILTRNSAAMAADERGTLQVGGVRYGYRQVGDHVEVEQVLVGGEPLQSDRSYLVATLDYVVNQAERYFGFPVPEVADLEIALSDAIAEAAQAAGTIRSEVDGRIRRLTP